VADWSKWEATRQKGRVHFILVRGLFIFGLSTALLWAFAMWAFQQGELVVLVERAMLFFPALGLLWGFVTWWNVERRYATYKSGGNP